MTTPDIGAPTEPGSEVAFSRETVSTAEFLSSTGTARTCTSEGVSVRFLYDVICSQHYLAIDFEPDVTLGAALNDGSYCHQTDDEGLPFFDRDVHLLSGGRATQKVPRGNHAADNKSISIQAPICTGSRTLGRHISPRIPGIPRTPSGFNMSNPRQTIGEKGTINLGVHDV